MVVAAVDGVVSENLMPRTPPFASAFSSASVTFGRTTATPRARDVLKPALELLAGIPTIVFGFFAVTFIRPDILQPIFQSIGPFSALAAGLAPIVCVGETRDERHSGRTFEVLARQVAELPADPRVVVAYEPVWAIGTGRNATPTDAAQVHRFIRERARARGWPGRLRVLYGGSVNAGNALAILAEPDVDGVLVGGASLSPEGWAEIVGLG